MSTKQAAELVTLIDALIAAKIEDALATLEDPMSCYSNRKEQAKIRHDLVAKLVGSAP